MKVNFLHLKMIYKTEEEAHLLFKKNLMYLKLINFIFKENFFCSNLPK
jgi:hypothetical protein